MDREFIAFKRNAIKAAKDLLYGEKVIRQIETATTISEIDKIMRNTRKGLNK